jgi:putative PIN family toxin of toxin-antitoxin system
MLRVVLDTNVYISAIVYGGLPDEIVQGGLDERFLMVTSEPLLSELEKKLRDKFNLSAGTIRTVLMQLRSAALIVAPAFSCDAVPADADDNRVIECAVEGNADCIVSGDGHLKALGMWQGIEIMAPREFSRRYL